MIIKIKEIPIEPSGNQFFKLMQERRNWKVGEDTEVPESIANLLLEKFPTCIEEVK